MALGAAELSETLVDETLGVVLKYEEDIRHVKGPAARTYLAEVAGGAAGAGGAAAGT
jgi:hypothetical protein